jgi:Xaa-Pro aminopeptidase
MFQTFTATSSPDQGPPRLAALRTRMQECDLDGFLVPRSDPHMGEYVAPRDERLAWLTGFTGSAGFCAVLTDKAGVFIDGRYRTQVKAQVAPEFTPVPWPDVTLADWLRAQCPNGGVIGFDPWLHAAGQIEQLGAALQGSGLELRPSDNLVDSIWQDQPAAPNRPARVHPLEYAGESHEAKRARLAADLRAAGQSAAIITLPDSLCWLLNIRGSDIAHNPVVHGFAILRDDAHVDLFIQPEKLGDIADHLGPQIKPHAPDHFLAVVGALEGSVRIDKHSLPQIVAQALGPRAVHQGDPCALPKACKSQAEIDGMIAAHLRDGVALTETLAWLSEQPAGTLHEIDVVKQLENTRRRDPSLRDISFDTIAGTGPNGAIMHYRVTHDSNSPLEEGQLLVLDSGGQYLDGTTDVTRTIAIGQPQTARTAFTHVLQGLIAMSRLRWPKGLAGRDIEAIGRMPLWLAGLDFNHGLGHGVGAYLSVHEGPQRLSRLSDVPFEPGMILSIEPGYYREGDFGIRIENLAVVENAPCPAGGDPDREMLQWRNLTIAPIDRTLIDTALLSPAERAWVDQYHAKVRELIRPHLSLSAQTWLEIATAPL